MNTQPLSVASLGVMQPKIVLYIDNQPLTLEGNVANVAELIEKNGNHWRKIFTIFAKLCSDDDWRVYRDTQLLQQEEQINFTSQMYEQATVHIFSGKQCWQRFSVAESALDNMRQSSCKRVFYKTNQQGRLLLYSPYFDYRQFPNILIMEVKAIIDRFYMREAK
ncbi:MAG: hypothetical protein ACI9ES_000391 [Oceanospirillaceae bacterium]